jgi:hypothetical protein
MRVTAVASVLLAVGGAGRAVGQPLPPRYGFEPVDTDGIGPGASNTLGYFRIDGGPRANRYFVATAPPPDGPGRLTMWFAHAFIDGPGPDFAILTSGTSWGPLADEALFEFFLGTSRRASLVVHLAPDRLFELELPGADVVADRVRVTNITPDPPGANDLATMTFDIAGVTTSVPEPASMTLCALGLALLGLGYRPRRGREPHTSPPRVT